MQHHSYIALLMVVCQVLLWCIMLIYKETLKGILHRRSKRIEVVKCT